MIWKHTKTHINIQIRNPSHPMLSSYKSWENENRFTSLLFQLLENFILIDLQNQRTFNLSQNIGGHCILDESECFYSSIYKCVLNHQTLYSNIHFFPLIENWNITISFLTCCLLNKNLPSQLWGPVARPRNNNNK